MIKRRSALASIATGIGAMITMPAWAKGWKKNHLSNYSFLAEHDEEVLSAITDTIIPKTDTPGANELGVPQFIQKITKDCYEVPAQHALSMGLVTTDAVAFSEYGNSFVQLNKEQRLAVLKKMSVSEYPDQKTFYNMIKRATIDGYMGSEYAMTNITKFEFAPNRYYGCVPVKPT
ncbi:MAG: gluconate 2-dehydrogenase subunit 3 family protein [Saprospiraceae bacterium]